MTQPTKISLRELEEKAKAATPGPWKADIGNLQVEQETTRYGICGFDQASRDGVMFAYPQYNPIDPMDDGEFIAAANPDTIQKLCAALRRAERCLSWIAEDSIKYRGTDAATAATRDLASIREGIDFG